MGGVLEIGRHCGPPGPGARLEPASEEPRFQIIYKDSSTYATFTTGTVHRSQLRGISLLFSLFTRAHS